jgi:hypothetical protein
LLRACTMVSAACPTIRHKIGVKLRQAVCPLSLNKPL